MRIDKVIKELDGVNAKLRGDAKGADRLALLRRQAALGDRRDAALDAQRRGTPPPR